MPGKRFYAAGARIVYNPDTHTIVIHLIILKLIFGAEVC